MNRNPYAQLTSFTFLYLSINYYLNYYYILNIVIVITIYHLIAMQNDVTLHDMTS